MIRKFRRMVDGAWLGGVCAGLAYYAERPVLLVRILWVCVVLFFGFGVGLYILLWIFVPKWERKPRDFEEITGD